ncbi:MAG: peptidylprolyl isomerase [Polyangiales bacterium]
MQAIAERIKEGASFVSLAQEYSDCPSASAGGDLGPFGRGQMVKAFEEAPVLPVDGVSDVVETEFGYHLIHRTA